MLEVGRDVGERTEDEGALGQEQVRDVEVVRDAEDRVAVEEDVDVERPWREAARLGRARGARAAEGLLERLHLAQQRLRRQGRLDRDDAVQVPGCLAPRQAGLVLPRLGLVEARGRHDLDGVEPPEPAHCLAEERRAVPDVRAEREVDARHQRLRVSSTAGVPTSPASGGVSFRTRTRTSGAGNSFRSASAMSPASRSIRFTRWRVPISTMRRATAP